MSQNEKDFNNCVFDITFFGTDDLFQPGRAESILTQFMRRPWFKPSHYGTGEDDLTIMPSANVESLSSFWRKNFFLFLARKEGEISYEAQLDNISPAEGHLLPVFSLLYIKIKISCTESDAISDKIRQFVFDMASVYRPCYACCYKPTKPTILWNLEKKGIPDIFWINIFGQPYVEMIGIEKIKSCPMVSTVMMDWGGIQMEFKNLSPEKREIVKQHLGHRFFVGGSRLFQGIRVPKFDFQKV